MKLIIRCITSVFACALVALNVGAQTNYSKSEILEIGNNVFLLEDEHNNFRIEDVVLSNDFVKSQSKVPNMGVTESSFWLKIPIVNTTDRTDLILILEQPFIDAVDLYSPNLNGTFELVQMGEYKPFGERSYNDPNYLFDIYIPSGKERVYYMKVSGKEQIQLPLAIGPPKLILEKRKQSDLLSGLYFGIIFVMMLYNLFIYFTTRDNSYLYYVAYIILIGLTQTSLQGYPFQFLWPNLPWLSEHSLFIFPALVGTSALLFMQNFLQVKVTLPKLNKLMIVFHLVYGAGLLLSLIGFYKLSYNIIELNAIVVSLYMLTISIIIVRRGYRPGRYFLLAWSTFLLGIIIFVMKDQGILPYNNLTRYTMHIGSAIEVILLSFALADRINTLKKEKEESQEQALITTRENARIIKEQNIVLEDRVKYRTIELEKSNVELSRIYNDLKNAQSQLVDSEKMASLGQLTAGIAHEINNPINFVTANVEPLRRDIIDVVAILTKYEGLDHQKDLEFQVAEVKKFSEQLELSFLIGEMDELISGIAEGANRTAEIVKGLRNFSRLDEVDLKYANVNDGLKSTLKLLDTRTNELEIDVKVELSETGAIECYPGKLNQLFMNLLTNAIQALEENPVENRKIHINTQEANNNLIIRIKDNGAGMSEETKLKIFEPFFTTKEVGEGTGLGLSIVYSIIELHAGSIKVESELGKGTEFIIEIPMQLA